MKRVLCLVLCISMMFVSVFGNADDFSNNPDEIENVVLSVLMLEVLDKDNEVIATGSGFLMFDNMTLVTNYHVIKDASIIIADSDDGYQYFVNKVLIASEENDIAILRFMTPTVMKPLEYSTESVKRGSKIVAIGSPIGLKNTVSIGNVSSVYNDNGINWIQFTAPISHGSSGGPLLNDNGKVVGITSAFYNDGQNLNLAIGINDVLNLYKKWDGSTTYDISDYRKAVYTKPTATPPPTAVPTPSPKPTHKPTKKPTESPTQTPTLAPDSMPLFLRNTSTPKPTAIIAPLATPLFMRTTPKPTAKPTVLPTVKPKRTRRPTPSPTPVITPTPTPIPAPSPSPTPCASAHSAESSFKLSFTENEIQLFSKKSKTIKPDIIPLGDSKKQSVRLTWSSSDSTVAKVNAEGVITAVSEGTAIITCASKADPETYALMFVHVVEPVAGIKLAADSTGLLVGAVHDGLDKTHIVASIEPSNAHYQELIWTSSNDEIASVDEKGRVTAHKAGTVTITATSTEPQKSPKKGTIKISIKNAVHTISDAEKNITLSVGKTILLKPTINPSNASNKALVWNSSNPKIATVNSTGQVKAVAVGSCTITCTAADEGGAAYIYNLSVVQPAKQLKAVSSEIRIKVGDTKTLTSLVRFEPSNTTNKKTQWIVNDSKGNRIYGNSTIRGAGIFEISGGKITFFKAGKYILVGTTTDGSNKSVKITVNVEPTDGVTLYIKDGAYATWDDLSGDNLKIKFEVTNREYGKAVKAFELYVYAIDTWGNRIYGESNVYYKTTTRTVNPGNTVYSDNFVIPNRSSIYEVYCGIHKILYSDGTTVEIDNVDFSRWEIH